ncbi:MAG TPA: hypothetical protein VFG91_03765 [Woeseiaceae bacterium]|nr:hypothetical protein [Woeseiaceae bacterium]
MAGTIDDVDTADTSTTAHVEIADTAEFKALVELEHELFNDDGPVDVTCETDIAETFEELLAITDSFGKTTEPDDGENPGFDPYNNIEDIERS